MGDRILFQVVSANRKTFSPVIYGHWSGSNARKVCAAIQQRMKGRNGDIEYTAARLVQELIGSSDGNTGFGIWNAKRALRDTAGESHGDAGIVLVIVDDNRQMEFECFGGYLKIDGGGLPKETA